MKYFICFLFIISFNCSAWSAENSGKLTSFQNQINECQLKLPDLKTIKNYQQLYLQIQKKYLIVSSRTLYRELTFKVKTENRKIKVTNDVVELFQVSDDETHIKIDIDPRHKSKNSNSLISQLILGAKIDKDWQKILEIRESSLRIEIVRIDGLLSQLKISTDKNKKSLDCQVVNNSEICLCHK